jgi:hypothetical protein
VSTGSSIRELTPHMREYAEGFDDRGTRWLPYLMYFNPTDHRSDVVNTDRLGFRLSHGRGEVASLGGRLPSPPVRLLVGSSTVFGIGATSDAATLASRLWSCHAPSTPWLNMAGRSHNSAQELLLFTLYRHLLPPVTEIVLFSGFNNLGLSRLPTWMHGDHGAFYSCVSYFERMGHPAASGDRAPSRIGRLLGRTRGAAVEEPIPEPDEQIARAVELTIRHLEAWRLLGEAMDVRVSFVLQPLATWLRAEPAPQERLLFDELDRIANFTQKYGDVVGMDVGRRYARRLRDGCARIGVRFLDIGPVIAAAVRSEDWLYVDRIHFTDAGYDLVAGLLARELELS